MPTHRIVLALRDGEFTDLRASTAAGTFAAYRQLPGAVHGMIAWPNTVLLTGPETIVVDPGYVTQGDMLAAALEARGIAVDAVRTVLATHLHSDHVSALPQLGPVELWVHERELATPHARAGRGWRDAAEVRTLAGAEGQVRPGIRFIHTPGHTEGHVCFVVEGRDGRVVIAGDTLGPRPEWFAGGELPEGFPERDAHLAAFRAIRATAPDLVIPGHNPPVRP